METIIEEQEKEFDEKFELESQGCSECCGFEFIDKTEIRYPKGEYHCEFDLEKIKRWHKEKVKQILQFLVESEKEHLMNLELLNGAKMSGYFKKLDMKESIGWNKAKQDTIQYLQEQIKKL